ncbi:norrin-like [Haliotis rubra]|uniref:norrin-like n=1 Tax=Haliotis rubra TaxID=36100 RepID=UPI001EE56679|nr:norrin-like [Haliotis rubra]
MLPTNLTSVCQTCTPRLMFGQIQQSIGFFKVNDNGEICSNVEPIPELKECAGYCGSTSSYTALMHGFDNKCLCCQPAKTVSKSIQLVCGTGRKITKTYNVPETCGCSACSKGA